MTIRLPDPNIFDRFLKLLGKKRGVIMPIGAYEKYGQYVYAKAQKESFWKALCRSSGDPLPDDLIDIFQIEDFREEIVESEKKIIKESKIH
jgi:hypothetical protein